MTLDQSVLSELADALKSSDGVDLVREAVRVVFQELIESELSSAIGAGLYERTDSRTNERNGHRPRVVSTKAGDVSLGIPKLRKGSFFPSILEPRRRIDQALYAVVMEMACSGDRLARVRRCVQGKELKEVPMEIVGGLDIHRAQITFDYVDLGTGEETRGVIRPATREQFRCFLGSLRSREAAFALEGTTGWRFVVEELRAARMEAHLAEPAETRAQRGPKRRAKTDRADARLLRDLLLTGRLPESWIPPAYFADLRTTVRLRKALVDEKGAWVRRMHAKLFHHGLPVPPELRTTAGRDFLDRADLPAASRELLDLGCRMVDRIDQEIDGIDRKLIALSRQLPGCAVLQRQWGIGSILAVTILAELGDPRRFSSSRKVVRFAGLDITVNDSDGKRSRGHITHQGSPLLRWAIYEAAGAAWRTASPDHDYYVETKARLGAKQARLAVARRILRRVHHELSAAGDAVLVEAA